MSLDALVMIVWFAGPVVGLLGGALAIVSARRASLPAAKEIRKTLRETAVIMPT